MTAVLPLFRAARPGDKVTILTPQGQQVSGRVVMAFATHCVLNMGGRHGRPGVADERNTIAVTARKDRKQ